MLRQAALVLTVLFCFPKAAQAKIDAWTIQEESSANGKYEFVVSKQGVKISSDAFGFVVVAKAPDWTVYVARPATKEMAKASIEDLKKIRLPSMTMGGDLQSLTKPLKVERGQDRGWPMLTYTFKGTGEYKSFWQEHEGDQRFIQRVELLSFDFPLPVEACTVLYKIHNLPTLAGCPSRLRSVYSEGRGGWALRTNGIAKTTLANDSIFNPPAYKNIGKLSQTFFVKGATTNNLEGMSDLLR